MGIPHSALSLSEWPRCLNPGIFIACASGLETLVQPVVHDSTVDGDLQNRMEGHSLTRDAGVHGGGDGLQQAGGMCADIDMLRTEMTRIAWMASSRRDAGNGVRFK